MLAVWINAALLASESQQVIWLRGLKLSCGGPAALIEANLMMTEKVIQGTNSSQRLMAGATPLSILKEYRTVVQANAARLLR